MSRLLDKYDFDLTNVRFLEDLYGEKLPDLLEPIRMADADVEALRKQVSDYAVLAGEIEALYQELAIARETNVWQGDAAERADGFWDGVLTVLKWIAAIILFVVAALLILVAFLLIVVAKLCELVGVVLAWVASVIAVVVVAVSLIATRGRGAAAAWNMVKAVLNGSYLQLMGIVADLGQGLGWVFEVAGKAVMWLGLYLIEVGGDLTDQPSDELERERDKLFA